MLLDPFDQEASLSLTKEWQLVLLFIVESDNKTLKLTLQIYQFLTEEIHYSHENDGSRFSA